ncbi:hypothetical protein PJK55_14495 [Exiguobacterium sp. MMG028]|uniref:hypothetical protein n=1 Tax=Exiguobacterium sp. MMG028 TaxID=3021979 RepID=UPI0022FE6426|nr:hypothetical protein [Exiguobacterium sp. MMG028]MDA5561945.1 hypothetical protein [Exiguobacterium sp. MMG028]
MFPEDPLDTVLDGIETPEAEDAVLVSGYGTKTWGIDWQNGRLFRADPVRTKMERVIKYLLTPRGQVEVYPDFGQDIDTGYGSLVWTLYGEVFLSEEEARLALQAICDEAVGAIEGVRSVEAEAVVLSDDRFSARIRIITTDGEEEIVDGIEFSN